MPEVRVSFDSNGDYLTRVLLDDLLDSGLDMMIVTRHCTDSVFNVDRIKDEIYTYIDEKGLSEYIAEYKENSESNVTYILEYKGKNIYVVANDWKTVGVDRGGQVTALSDENVRTAPCVDPIRYFCIGYDGSVKGCCNLYFDDADYGNVSKESLLDCYFNNLRDLKLEMVKFGEKKGGCRYCTMSDNSDASTKELREQIG